MTHAPPDALDVVTASPRAGFADALRLATASVHREAERSGVLADLIRGRATHRAYALLLRNLVPVYAALENALEARREVPSVAVLADSRLRRSAALTSDVEAIAGADWQRSCPLLPEATAYAAAVTAAGEDPPKLVAHAYARYLGDLSGGQILKPILTRTLSLPPTALGFYEFPQLDDVAAAKAAIRVALDAVPPDSTPAVAILAEAVAAFRHNIAVAEAVRAAAG